MGDSLYVMGGQLPVPVCPTGALARDGWMPCTFVKLVSIPPSKYSGAIAAVDRSDGTGTIAGVLLTGPQHAQPVEKESDMWTTDKRQRPGGETRSDWTAIDAANVLQMDSDGLLGRVGTSVVTMSCGSDGMFKTYVFEKDNLAERTIPGSGSPLVYLPGDTLYVSSRGLLTNEKESPSHVFLGYAVYRFDSDQEGDFVIFATAMAFE
jgi:hypothetical protein